MKQLIFLVFIFSISTGLISQEKNEEKGIAVLQFGVQFTAYSEIALNSILSASDIAELRENSFGSGLKLNYMPNNFGINVSGGIEFNRNNTTNSISGMTVLLGKIGPTIRLYSSKNGNFEAILSPLYQYNYYNIFNIFNQGSELDLNSYSNQQGNSINLSRNHHFIGCELSLDHSFFRDNSLSLSVGYFYGLNESSYSSSGYTGVDNSIPTENSQLIQVSMYYTLKSF